MTLTGDCYGIQIVLHGVDTSASSVQRMVKICSDSAGNNVLIPNLLAFSSPYMNMGGLTYYFPLYIPSGTTLYAFAQASDTAGTAIDVWVTVWGNPSRPSMVRCGHYIDALGADTATSSGTAITPGTTLEGVITQIYAGVPRTYWYLQPMIVPYGDSNIGVGTTHVDLAIGYGGTFGYHYIQHNVQFGFSTTSESMFNVPNGLHECSVRVREGGNIWACAQHSASLEGAYRIVVYALGDI
jgi:hypothetical protein